MVRCILWVIGKVLTKIAGEGRQKIWKLKTSLNAIKHNSFRKDFTGHRVQMLEFLLSSLIDYLSAFALPCALRTTSPKWLNALFSIDKEDILVKALYFFTISFYFITNMCVTIYQHDKGFEILLDSLIDVLLDVLPAPIEILWTTFKYGIPFLCIL